MIQITNSALALTQLNQGFNQATQFDLAMLNVVNMLPMSKFLLSITHF